MELRLLGPFELVGREGLIRVGARKQRQLLSLLAMYLGEAVSTDQLIDQLWDEDPPSTALRTLRGLVSRLRGSVGDETIVRDGSGYRLALDADAVDVHRFGRLISEARQRTAEGRWNEAIESFDRALELWRGAPFADLRDRDAGRASIVRLESLRVDAEEGRLEALLGAGRGRDSIAELEQFVLREPLRERGWELLMVALYRSGRQADALKTYQRARDVLIDGAGVEPGPSLRALEQAVLSRDPVLSSGVPGIHAKERSRPLHNLRPDDREIVGREHELEHISALTAEHRLISVTGPGGVGKTSVLRHVARRLVDRAAGDVWWCDLVTAKDGDVVHAVAEASGIRSPIETGGELGQALAQRPPTWLLLDNCEHVVDAVAVAAQAVLAASDVRIISSTRMTLDVPSERIVTISPLRPDAATELFVGTARRCGVGEAAVADRELVASICDRVDRLPLAIELVAARARVMSLADLDTHVSSILFGSGRTRDTDDRHATMTAAIDWSVELLDERSAAALGELAVFAGTFDLNAAAAVLGSALDTVDVLTELVSHGLVQVEAMPSGARYRLLEPIRQYAVEQLWRSSNTTRDRHLDHYLGRLEDAYQALRTHSCMPVLELIHHDMANLGAVHDWALETGRLADDLRLYRPLAICFMHDQFAPYRWALQTIDHDEVNSQPGWGSALFLASWFLRTIRIDQEAADQLRPLFDEVAPDDPSIDLIGTGKTLGLGFEQGEWGAGWVEFSKMDRGDPFCDFIYYFLGGIFPLLEAIVHGGDQAVALDETFAVLREGAAWAERIGAKNFEAAILEQTGQILLIADPDRAMEISRQAERLAEELELTYIRDQARLHQVRASMLGAHADEPPAVGLTRVLESALLSQYAQRISWALPAAAHLLAGSGRHDVATLCDQPDAQPQPLGPPPIDENAPGVAQARRLRSDLSIFEIAQRAIEALESVRG